MEGRGIWGGGGGDHNPLREGHIMEGGGVELYMSGCHGYILFAHRVLTMRYLWWDMV